MVAITQSRHGLSGRRYGTFGTDVVPPPVPDLNPEISWEPIPQEIRRSIFSYASINDNTLIPYVTNKIIRVWMIEWTTSGSVGVEFKSNDDSLTEVIHCVTGQRYAIGLVRIMPSHLRTYASPPLECSLNASFLMNLDTDEITVSGRVWYELVSP